MRKLLWVVLFWLCFSEAALAENAELSVIQASGLAERWSSQTMRWIPVASGDSVLSGDRLRTGVESSIDCAIDTERRVLVRLGEDSAATYLNASPRRLALDQGVLYVRQEITGPSVAIRILTARFLVELENGGIAVEAASSAMPAQVKVFSEEVKIYPRKGTGFHQTPSRVSEGLVWMDGGAVHRMTYEDYVPWSEWYKKSDEQKDKLRFYT